MADAGPWTALLLMGLAGSVGHCLGMCGPLVLMIGARSAARGRAAAVLSQLAYHLARILVYALLGVLAGALGMVLGQGQGLTRAAGAVSVVLGLIVIAVGMGYMGWLPLPGAASGNTWWDRAADRAFGRPGLGGAIALGALNGLLPCGMVYGAIAMSVSAGGALQGGLGMLLFGLGTLPALLVLGLGVRVIPPAVRLAVARVAFVLMGLVGLQLILRGLAALGIVSHLHLWGLMLW